MVVYLILLATAGLLLSIGFLPLLLGLVGFWYFTLVRGRLSVRAFSYITLLGDGMTPEVANQNALALGFRDASQYGHMTKECAEQFYNGKQLAMIADARRAGFRG